MSIRHFTYQIDYIHILTFREEYKEAVVPYFGFDKIEYAIDNENTINEGIRLIFKIENIAIVVRKEALAIIFEGDIAEMKDQNGPIKLFWEIFEKIKKFKGFTKAARHTLIVHAVDIRKEEEIAKILNTNTYLAKNPFGKLEDFACTYVFEDEDSEYKFMFGTYSEKDIKIYSLMPFKTEFNKDLPENVGLMARFEAKQTDKNPTFSKFKHLLSKAEAAFLEFKV